MDKELSLIKECPNDECEYFNGHSKMCYSCGWIETRQHYTRANERSKVAQEIKREIEQYAGEARFDDSGDGCKYYIIYTKWWELFWKQYEVNDG